MFTPLRCPNENCKQHAEPEGKFFQRSGSYRAKCRSHAVPRFLCKTCGKGFSRQTFRADYYDKKPHLNVRVVEFLIPRYSPATVAAGPGDFRRVGKLSPRGTTRPAPSPGRGER